MVPPQGNCIESDRSMQDAVKKPELVVERPTREEAEAAVKVLLAYTGDDPEREGLIDTPKRVVKAYDEYFAGL